MAQLPGDGSAPSEPVPTPADRDPYDVPAALDRFYSGVHRAAAAHPEHPAR
jgi:hypothetical protein